MPSPSEKATLAAVRRASTPELVELYRFRVNAPVNRVEEVQAQRWLGLAIRGELFRRGEDPSVIVDTAGVS